MLSKRSKRKAKEPIKIAATATVATDATVASSICVPRGRLLSPLRRWAFDLQSQSHELREPRTRPNTTSDNFGHQPRQRLDKRGQVRRKAATVAATQCC